MTIDERLTRLTERHEALTGHVEILTADIAKFTSDVTRLALEVTQMRSVMDDLLVGFRGLVDLARSHELRIERLEGR